MYRESTGCRESEGESVEHAAEIVKALQPYRSENARFELARTALVLANCAVSDEYLATHIRPRGEIRAICNA
jgi:hypothetical protein